MKARILILLCLFLTPALQCESTYDLLVEGAVDFELPPLLAALEHKQEVHLASWTYWTGDIAGLRVVVSRTDMGPINAVTATTLAFEHFHPKAIINQGTAGGHDPKLHLYDIVLGEKTVDYSAYKSDHADQGAGVSTARWQPMYHKIHGVEYRSFAGDASLLAAASAVPYEHGKLVKGTVGSAFQFNRELDQLAWYHKVYGTDSEDMESAFVAGAAAGLDVPFLAIRILSDTEWTHPHLERDAGTYCAQFTVDVIRKLAQARRKPEAR